jgi:hypothetical protein
MACINIQTSAHRDVRNMREISGVMLLGLRGKWCHVSESQRQVVSCCWVPEVIGVMLMGLRGK